MAKTYKKNQTKIFDMCLIAMFSVLIAVCSWTTLPAVVPFTLQTFGVFCAAGLLGGKRGTITVLVYMLLAAVGLPVLSGFKGGISSLLGPTGGYILGFLFITLIYWIMTGIFGEKMHIKLISMVIGAIVMYAFGTIWFVYVYSKTKGEIGIMQALTWCVFPYIIPDMLKLALAMTVIKLIPKKYLNR